MRVKISSETAGSITLSPVVVQEMTLENLLGWMLGLTGKDVERIQGLLRRGTFVGGASRFRWEAFEISNEELERALDSFPDPDPSQPLRAEACLHIVLTGRHARIEVSREPGSKRRFLRRQSFWDAMLSLAGSAAYETYSYKEGADVYVMSLDSRSLSAVHSAASLLTFSTLERQIRDAALDSVRLFVKR